MEDGSPAETWEMSNNSWQQNVKLGLEIKHNRSKIQSTCTTEKKSLDTFGNILILCIHQQKPPQWNKYIASVSKTTERVHNQPST